MEKDLSKINEAFEQFIKESIEQELENEYFEEVLDNKDLQSREEKSKYWAGRNKKIERIFDVLISANIQNVSKTRNKVPVIRCHLTPEEYGIVGPKIKKVIGNSDISIELINDDGGYNVQIY